MNRDYFVQLFQYNDWANRRVWVCALKTSQEDYHRDNSFSIGSVYQQLLHTLNIERWWIGYLATGHSGPLPRGDIERYRDRDKLRQLWDETNDTNMAYIVTLTDEEIRRRVKVPWWEDGASGITVAQALTQVAHHSTDHRAQTMAVLHMLGYDGAEQDFIQFLQP